MTLAAGERRTAVVDSTQSFRRRGNDRERAEGMAENEPPIIDKLQNVPAYNARDKPNTGAESKPSRIRNGFRDWDRVWTVEGDPAIRYTVP